MNPKCLKDPYYSFCGEAECPQCSERDCPDKQKLHYHHDGCPYCGIAVNGVFVNYPFEKESE